MLIIDEEEKQAFIKLLFDNIANKRITKIINVYYSFNALKNNGLIDKKTANKMLVDIGLTSLDLLDEKTLNVEEDDLTFTNFRLMLTRANINHIITNKEMVNYIKTYYKDNIKA